MASLTDDPIFQYNNDTLQFLRKQYDLDKPERLDEAITIILDWLKKQDHIVKKDYSKEYLERFLIINGKGSVEKAKKKLGQIAVLRTFLPQFFVPLPDVKNVPILDQMIMGVLPKMTKDHYRVFLLQSILIRHVNCLMDLYRYIVMICEYVQAYDYTNGFVIILDYTGGNTFELMKSINIMEFHQFAKIVTEGFGMRIKSIHLIERSKTAEMFLTFIKKAISKKLAERVTIHKSIEDVYANVPKEIMTNDYGGEEKSLVELSQNWKSAVESEKFMKHLEEMQNARTNENYRCDDKFNEDYGIAGSFRHLSVD